jgi:hypothetical protein
MAGQTNPITMPTATHTAPACVTGFAEFAARTYGYCASPYLDLWQCSVARLDDFWDAVWTFSACTCRVLTGPCEPG